MRLFGYGKGSTGVSPRRVLVQPLPSAGACLHRGMHSQPGTGISHIKNEDHD